MVSRFHGAVLAWLQAVDNANLQLVSVSLGEIQAGIEITREQDGAKASAWAQLMHCRSDTLYEDAMIAAIALAHGLTVVTRSIQSLRVQGALRAANRR
jgi:predicted nucleic acid-binding protein